MNEEILKDLEQERKQVVKVNRLCTLGAVVMIILGILFIFLFEAFLIFFMIIIAVILISVSSSKKKKFSSQIKSKIISKMIYDELGADATYQMDAGMSLDEVQKSGIYKLPDRFHLEDYISSKYNGIPYEMCDAVLEEKHVTHDSKGNRRVTYVKYFSGRIIKIDFKRNFNFNIKVVEGNPNGLSTRGLEKMETEVIDFNKKYNTYVSSKEDAFYILTPVFIQKMLELEKLFKGTIQFSFTGDIFYIFINNNGDSLECDIHKPLDEKMLNIIRSQITLAATIINEFGLDKNKFNNQ